MPDAIKEDTRTKTGESWESRLPNKLPSEIDRLERIAQEEVQRRTQLAKPKPLQIALNAFHSCKTPLVIECDPEADSVQLKCLRCDINWFIEDFEEEDLSLPRIWPNEEQANPPWGKSYRLQFSDNFNGIMELRQIPWHDRHTLATLSWEDSVDLFNNGYYIKIPSEDGALWCLYTPDKKTYLVGIDYKGYFWCECDYHFQTKETCTHIFALFLLLKHNGHLRQFKIIDRREEQKALKLEARRQLESNVLEYDQEKEKQFYEEKKKAWGE